MSNEQKGWLILFLGSGGGVAVGVNLANSSPLWWLGLIPFAIGAFIVAAKLKG